MDFLAVEICRASLPSYRYPLSSHEFSITLLSIGLNQITKSDLDPRSIYLLKCRTWYYHIFILNSDRALCTKCSYVFENGEPPIKHKKNLTRGSNFTQQKQKSCDYLDVELWHQTNLDNPHRAQLFEEARQALRGLGIRDELVPYAHILPFRLETAITQRDILFESEQEAVLLKEVNHGFWARVGFFTPGIHHLKNLSKR